MGVQDPYDEWDQDHLILDERATAFGRYVKNFVMDGFGLADGGGLTVDVGQAGASFAYVNGYELRQDGVESRALAASSTNHVFLFFTKSPDPIAGTDAITVDLEVNTTGVPLTSDSIKLGEVDTDGAGVTAVREQNNDFRIHDAQLETDLDARQNQITELVHHKGTAFPSSPVAGQPFFRTDLGTLHIWDGGSWVTIGASGSSANVQENGGTVVTGATDLNFEDGIVAAAGGPGEATLNLDYGGTAELADSDASPESAGTSPKTARADHKHRVSTGSPIAQVVGTGSTGGATSVAKSDHVHPMASETPAAITAGSNLEGSKTTVARSDHQHAHGGLPGGSLHATATPGTAGFMSAADKAKLDTISVEGLDVKESVRAATTAPVTLATDVEAGDVLDGVVLSAGDRILIKDQPDPKDNGVYIVQPVGLPLRASDFDVGTVTAGAFAFVEEGTDNADSGWVLITDDPFTVGVDPLTFTQFTGLGQITAGGALVKTGNTLDVVAADGTITVNPDSIQVGTVPADQVDATADRTWGKTAVLQPGEHAVTGGTTVYTKASAAVVDFDQLPTTASKHVFRWDQTAVPASGSAEVRLRDITNGVTLGELTGITTTGLKSFVLSSVPSGAVRVEVQHRKTLAGSSSNIEGGTLVTEN